MQTLSDYMNQIDSLDNPGLYEFYELESDETGNRFVILNTLNGRAVLINNTQNRILIDGKYKPYGKIEGTKISAMKFFERLKGLGVEYK